MPDNDGERTPTPTLTGYRICIIESQPKINIKRSKPKNKPKTNYKIIINIKKNDIT